MAVHYYEGVAVAKVCGFIEADTQEEARELLMNRELGEVEAIYLQSVALLDDLDPVEEENGEEENNEGASSTGLSSEN